MRHSDRTENLGKAADARVVRPGLFMGRVFGMGILPMLRQHGLEARATAPKNNPG
jgi:hypothetical protein